MVLGLVSRKQLAAHDRRCDRLGKRAEQARKQSIKFGSKVFKCKTNKCRTKASRKRIDFGNKAQKLRSQQSDCQRLRPD